MTERDRRLFPRAGEFGELYFFLGANHVEGSAEAVRGLQDSGWQAYELYFDNKAYRGFRLIPPDLKEGVDAKTDLYIRLRNGSNEMKLASLMSENDCSEESREKWNRMDRPHRLEVIDGTLRVEHFTVDGEIKRYSEMKPNGNLHWDKT